MNTSHIHPLLTSALALITALLTLTGCASATDDAPNPDQQADDGIDRIQSSESRITNPSVSPATVRDLTEDNANFAADLYHQLVKTESGNFFYSPHSLSSALAMTYAGARGSTQSQMKTALHFNLSRADLHAAFNKLDLTLEQRAQQTGHQSQGSPFKLNIANAIWGQRSFSFKQPFLDTLARHYGAGLQGLDFVEQPDTSRQRINTWVEQQTDGLIQDLMPPSSINRDTRLVLTNAIYFKASWLQQFDPNHTHQQSFTTASGQSVQVDMMSLKQRSGLRFASGSNWQAVGLPYVGDKVSMAVIVPDAGAFSQVEQQLTGPWLNSVFNSLSNHAVDLEMPKFNIESKFSANDLLKALGMQSPFQPGDANFSGITADADLFIQDVIHQSFISVDETGTEAAAATGVSSGVVSVPQYKQLTIDRPFIFTIYDHDTHAVIFTGRLTNPS